MAKKNFDIASEISKDERLTKMLDYHTTFEESLEKFSTDDFLEPDEYMDIPFFATTRDYIGAYEKEDPNAKWIIKKIPKEEARQFQFGEICYFLNYFTGNTAAPSLVTKLGGEYYRASKIMIRTEQLSGAPYLEQKVMRDQLALDLINSWVTFDEDRNPNNYLIYYTPGNFPIIITIDFSNVDLMDTKMKIKGTKDTFGWERPGKTRYMTPLKTELFYTYSWDFFKKRFDAFDSIQKKDLEKICNHVFKDVPKGERTKLADTITANIMKRRDYIRDYFYSWYGDEKIKTLQERSVHEMREEYGIMGSSFLSTQEDFENE
ncbi:hypothetical protein [Spirochaeta cellobiosiphila]|uniref:hypothetical protein n=1 Tax=Spirochaeta cellobiosiphila TaxID=504483 RepID=UPI000401DAE3|nr:hypothetical protein [Spirochaeta cellobiosiphila]